MKIRTDFVTNSSSSSFVAYGIYDEELAEKVEKLLLKYQAYPKDTIGWINVSDNVVTVTRQLCDVDGGGDYYINQLLEDDYDGRSSEQEAEDEEEALTATNIISALEGFFDEDFPNYDVKKLIHNAVYEEGAMCRVYVDQTDGYDAEDFSYYEQTLKANREKNRALEESNTTSSGTYTICDDVKFKIPAEYFVINDYASEDGEDEDDNGICTIYGYQYFNDDGKELYKNKVEVSFDSLDIDDTIKREFDVQTLSQVRGVKIHNLQKSPFVSILNIPIKFTIIENVLSTYLSQTCLVIQTENDKSLVFTWKANVKGYDDEEHYGYVLDILKALTVNDSPIAIGKMTAKSLKNKMQIDFDSLDSDEGDDEDECEESVDDYNNDIGDDDYDEDEFGIYDGDLFKYYGNKKHVVIPNVVKSISPMAFHNCENLVTVTIGDNVTQIHSSAFSGCPSLKKVQFGNGITEMPACFEGCPAIEELIIPNSVITISGGLGKNNSLKKLVISNSAKVIETAAFTDNTALEKIVIPDSVEFVGEIAFSGCASAKELIVGESVVIIGDNAFSFLDSVKTIVLPDSLKEIGAGGFSYCKSLKSINIPDSVVSIGEEAFTGCKNLESIFIPKTVKTMGARVFYSCNRTTIYIEAESKPDGWDEEWLDYSFNEDQHNVVWGATELNNHSKIHDKEELGCISKEAEHKAKEEAERKRVVGKTIGDNAEFTVNRGILKQYTGSADHVVLPDSVTKIGERAFDGCKTIKSIDIPNTIVRIDGAAFRDCTSLQSIKLPDSIEKIEWQTFQGCTSLKSVYIPSTVTNIAEGAFRNCTSLKTVFIPDSVKSTGVDIFEGCKNLTIHVQAESKPRFWLELWNIDNLPVVWGANPSEYESSVHFAKSENHEFEQANHQECVKAALKEQVQSNVPTYHDRRQFTIDDVIHCAIPDGYRSGANDGVNSGWTYTVSENTPDGSNHIDAKPFSFAIASRPANTQPFNEGMLDSMEMMFKLKGLLNPNVQVRRVISDLNCAYLYQTWYDVSDPTYNKANGFLLTEVGGYQFHAYHNHGGEVDSQDTAVIDNFIEVLEEWMKKTKCVHNTITDSTSQIKIKQSGDTTTIFYPGKSNQSSVSEADAFEINDGVLISYNGNSANVLIPQGVIEIGNQAFYRNMYIENVTIPNSVTKICKNAFAYSRFLEKVTIPSSVMEIEDSAFFGCTAVTIFCEVDSKPSKWHEDWNWLHWGDYCPVVWGSNVKDHDEEKEAPAKAKTPTKKKTTSKTTTTSIQDFEIEDGVLTKYKGNQSHVVVPDFVERIACGAFSECTSIESVQLNDGLKEISSFAFSECSALSEIDFPDTLTKIENNAFYECTSLVSVNIPDSVVFIGNSAFSSCSSLREAIFSNSITTLNSYVLGFCDSLQHFEVPNSVTNIEECAITWAEEMVSITIPSSVKTIKPFAFQSCNDNMTIYCEANSKPNGWDEKWNNTSSVGDNKYKVDWSKVANVGSNWEDSIFEIEDGVLKKYKGNQARVVIPDSVEKIGLFAFDDCESIVSVEFNDNLKSIDAYAFSGCSSLREIRFPEGLRSIDDNAFAFCASLTTAHIPISVVRMGNKVFMESPLTAIYCDAESKPSDWEKDWDKKFYEEKGRHTVYWARKLKPKSNKTSKNVVVQSDAEAAERKTREEEALRTAKEVASGNSIEEAYRKAQEDAERRKQEVDKRKAQEAEIKQKREEFITSETKIAEEECQNTLAKLSNEYNTKATSLEAQITEKEKELAATKQKLESMSFFTFLCTGIIFFIRKGILKNKIQNLTFDINTLKNEKATLVKKYDDSKREAETQLKNKLSSLPMRSGQKYPMPKK